MTVATSAVSGRNAARVLRLTPSLRKAFRATIAGLKDNLNTRVLFSAGGAESEIGRLFALPEVQALSQAERVTWANAVRQAGTWALRDVPYKWATGPFDVTSQASVDALRSWETKLFTAQLDAARDGLRYSTELGWVRALDADTRDTLVKASVGMGQRSWDWLTNYEQELRQGQAGNALTRQLRDKRSDSTVANAAGEALPDATVHRLVTFYAKALQRNGEDAAVHTGALNAYRVGQQQSIVQAVDLNGIDPAHVKRKWIGRDDGRERPTHVAMNNTVVGLTEPWQVPGVGAQMTPGEDEYGCRCTVGYLVG